VDTPEPPAFASVSEAMDMVLAGLSYLAAADPTAQPTEAQAECLRGLERTDAISTAVRASFLSAFTIGQGYTEDADYSARAWLMHKTGITRGAAASHTAWAKRASAHPQVVAALITEDLSESYGRAICQWTDKLPEKFREESDELLIAAAAAGLDLRDLAALFAEMYERARSELPDDDPDGPLEDRAVRLMTTFQGAGVLNGDLTPECAAVVGAVLDALSSPAGPEDTRTREQRYHDALQEAMRRLVAADLLPERAGQPVKIWAHMSLADLLRFDGSSALQEEWTAQVRAQWAAHRAAASEGGSDGGGVAGWRRRRGHRLRRSHGPDRDRGCERRGAGGPDPGVRGTGPAPPRWGRRRRRRARAGHRAGVGGAGAGDHRQGGGPAVRPRRPGQLPAPPPARGAAGRA